MPARAPSTAGEPAALGDFVDWALEQHELAGCPGPEDLLAALQALAGGGGKGGGKGDGEGGEEAVPISFICPITQVS